MGSYVMFGKYSLEAVKQISTERTDKALALLKKLGGELKAGYVLLGETDVVIIAEFPGMEQAMKASVGLTKLLGISFTTSPAVTFAEFDKLIAQ